MTLPDERYRAVVQTEKFLRELLATPRIPKAVKDQARWCLRHYPGEWEMEAAAACAPAVFQKRLDPLHRMILKYEEGQDGATGD